MTVKINVPRFCTLSICGWNLFQPLGLYRTVHYLSIQFSNKPFSSFYLRYGLTVRARFMKASHFHHLEVWYVEENHAEMKCNEWGFRPFLCTYRLNWARRASSVWWNECDDTALQSHDSKNDPWWSEAEHATVRSRRLSTILFFFYEKSS